MTVNYISDYYKKKNSRVSVTLYDNNKKTYFINYRMFVVLCARKPYRESFFIITYFLTFRRTGARVRVIIYYQIINARCMRYNTTADIVHHADDDT